MTPSTLIPHPLDVPGAARRAWILRIALRVAMPIAGLAATLLDCIEHPQAWALRGEHAHRRASSRYSWAAKLDAAEALYRESLERRAPAKGRLGLG